MYPADPTLAKAAHFRFDQIALAENAARGLDQRAARHSGVRLLAQTLDQPHSKTPFEFADLQADCRLRQVEAAGRGREASALDHFNDGPQLIEVEAAHAKLSLSKRLKHKICLIRE